MLWRRSADNSFLVSECTIPCMFPDQSRLYSVDLRSQIAAVPLDQLSDSDARDLSDPLTGAPTSSSTLPLPAKSYRDSRLRGSRVRPSVRMGGGPNRAYAYAPLCRR